MLLIHVSGLPRAVVSEISLTQRRLNRGPWADYRYGLLRGVGQVSKHVKIKDLADANKDALRYYSGFHVGLIQ